MIIDDIPATKNPPLDRHFLIEDIGNEKILKQYQSAKKEVEELEQSIKELEKLKDELNERKHIKGIVKGGAGGKRIFHVDGYSEESMEDLEYLIRKDIRLLNERKATANELVIEVDKFINSITDSRIRRMISFKYKEGMDWNRIAHSMGYQCTADSCRMELKRFFKKI